MQERLWITEPRRVTCLARVIGVQGDWFAVDRALFAPRSTALRHPQYADGGTIWWNGEKRKLAGVQERDGRVWNRLRGTVPTLDAELQCQLDQARRGLNDRAHTAMHLTIVALQEAGGPAMVAHPEVKGGGHFRLTLARPVAPDVLAKVRQRVQAAVQENLEVKRAFATRPEVERFATAQTFEPYDPYPGEEPVPLVHVGSGCVLPCDGTHVAWTQQIGSLVFAHARGGKAGFVLVGKVKDA